MLIHRIADIIYRSKAAQTVEAALNRGEDATFAVAQSARTLLAAAQFARNPRPTVYIVSGEEAADRAARSFTGYLGVDRVVRFPERKDLPWKENEADANVVAQRCQALSRLNAGEDVVMVCSARSLLRCVPPAGEKFWQSQTFSIADEINFDEVPRRFVAMGYTSSDEASQPGLFAVHGDTIDVFPAQENNAIRIEFFGDEIDRIRRVVTSTGQTIGDLMSIEIFPVRELSLTDQTVSNLKRALYKLAQDDNELASVLEMANAGVVTPELDRFLPLLYGETQSPLAHLASNTLIILAEPRSLFDDCMRAYEDLTSRARQASIPSLDGLYVSPRNLDFGKQQRLNYVSIIRAGGVVTAEMKIEQPSLAGSHNRFISRIREVVSGQYSVVFSMPDRGGRESMELTLSDESIAFDASFMADQANAHPLTIEGANARHNRILRGRVTFVDNPIPGGVVIPEVGLAIFTVNDLNAQLDARKKRVHRRVDVTEITFPFKPGDYVVHATHGIAYFKCITRREVAGKERDYFLLEYAGADKLYVPFEQVDLLTRYVGPDGSNPRLTRLNTADWTRATNKARKSAKKLAFDLVDLYTRRASVVGYACGPDTPAQLEMEESFPYEPTHDQLAAIADIKSDMEAPKPMDRLLCGDVGFGKTEVALRAAFKCVSEGRQVMVLCPTTILAQQHFETFFERFAPFDVEVDVLSRFRTPRQQRMALEGFAEGNVRVLVGTHRLLSSDVNPRDLGLVIIDEEQRFGVQHKEQLKNLREQIDVLTLSATPIPRTMQMALSGVRDMSLITTPPTGRRPVAVTVSEYDPDIVSAAIRLELERGGQVYYVSNRVKTIEDAVERVHEAVPEACIGIAHGKMSAREVEDVMVEFDAGRIDVLVATTIIESGIDNPHTNTLIIEDSQRLGLAQLYQLKGRVGRSSTQAYAYFMFPAEMPLTEEAVQRLTALAELQELGSGMQIAMRDLEIRGAGSLVGADQHGNLSSVGFDLFTQMLGQAVEEARGDNDAVEQASAIINLSADFYLDEEFIPAVDKRVMVYRKLAGVTDLEAIDELESQVIDTFGELPLAAQNLFDRARMRIRAERLGIESISLVSGRILYTNIDVPKNVAFELRKRYGALAYPQSHKFGFPFKVGEDNLVSLALRVLVLLGDSEDGAF